MNEHTNRHNIKYALIFIFVIYINVELKAQKLKESCIDDFIDSTEISLKDTSLFNYADKLPELIGVNGEKIGFYLNDFIKENLRIPPCHCSGKVFLSGIIEKDGTLTDIRIIKGIMGCQSYNEEALRIVNLMRHWIPGEVKGKPVRFQRIFVISFISN